MIYVSRHRAYAFISKVLDQFFLCGNGIFCHDYMFQSVNVVFGIERLAYLKVKYLLFMGK